MMKAKIIINEAKQAKQEDKRDLSSDIFTAGNVVVSKETGIIVLVIGSSSFGCIGFSGSYFTGLDMDEFNTSDYFLKDNFVQVHGNIVISTEE